MKFSFNRSLSASKSFGGHGGSVGGDDASRLTANVFFDAVHDSVMAVITRVKAAIFSIVIRMNFGSNRNVMSWSIEGILGVSLFVTNWNRVQNLP